MFDPQQINYDAFNYYTRLQRGRSYVSQHICDDLSLRKAARVAGLEHKYFSTFFHAKAGVPFKQWVSYLRVKRAKEMMEDANHSITHIAGASGFQDVRTFERTFKRVMSMTPMQYKKSVRPA